MKVLESLGAVIWGKDIEVGLGIERNAYTWPLLFSSVKEVTPIFVQEFVIEIYYFKLDDLNAWDAFQLHLLIDLNHNGSEYTVVIYCMNSQEYHKFIPHTSEGDGVYDVLLEWKLKHASVMCTY